MPGLTVQLPDLQAEGPRLEVRLTDTAGAASPAAVDALIDTGATVTVVANQVLKRLGLNPVGTALVHTPSSTNVRCYKYVVRLCCRTAWDWRRLRSARRFEVSASGV